MNITSSFGAAGIGLAVAFGADFTANKVNPPARALIIEELSYSGGNFTQRLSPTTGPTMPGRWTAEVVRVLDGITYQLCAGSGDGVYNGTTDTYTASDWTGADCPALQPGDRAEAVWTFTDENGLQQSIGAILNL